MKTIQRLSRVGNECPDSPTGEHAFIENVEVEGTIEPDGDVYLVKTDKQCKHCHAIGEELSKKWIDFGYGGENIIRCLSYVGEHCPSSPTKEHELIQNGERTGSFDMGGDVYLVKTDKQCKHCRAIGEELSRKYIRAGYY